MGASPSSSPSDRPPAFGSSQGFNAGSGAEDAAGAIKLKMEDLELPPRRDILPGSTPQPGGNASMEQFMGQMGGAGGNPGTAAASRAGAGAPSVTEELFPGGEPLGQRAFQNDGLVGTETQQLSLLAYYAECCEDFRRYQRQTRADGGPRDAAAEGAQLLLLSGSPGTGKTQHAVSFARALGLPLLLANPANGSCSSVRTVGWSAQLRKEVNGRDCVVFFDEIDQHAGNEAFASELRQFLDGVCQPSGSRVLLVGTTNRIDRLPEDVIHRAEVIPFVRPQAEHLAQMWRGYAQHLREDELTKLSVNSELGGITGRDVRHCASWAERHMVIQYLNSSGVRGYCHGAALSDCPPPPLDQYMQCVQSRSVGGMRPGVMTNLRSWIDAFK